MAALAEPGRRARAPAPVVRDSVAVLPSALLVAACGSTARPAGRSPRPRWRVLGRTLVGAPVRSTSAGRGGVRLACGHPASPAPPVPRPRRGRPRVLVRGRSPCPDTRFECVTLAVPKDHFARRRRRNLGGDVRHPARHEGEEGHLRRDHRRARATATSRRRTATSTTTRPRSPTRTTWSISTSAGSGCPDPIQCTEAAAIYYHVDGPPRGPGRARAAATAARAFARDCVAESGVDEADLPFYATAQAVEDLEAVRDYLGVDKMDLYGLSYGTQFVQTYAAAHPDRIATLYVDGPVDLTVDGPTLLRRGRPLRRGHAGGDSRLRARPTTRARRTWPAETRSPPTTRWHRGSPPDRSASTSRPPPGRPVRRRADERGPRVRGLLLPLQPDRSVPPAARDRRGLPRRLGPARASSPTARSGIDPETLGPIAVHRLLGRALLRGRVPGLRVLPGRRGSRRADRRLDRRRRMPAGINDLRLATSFYGDLPCLYWPNAPAPRRCARRRSSTRRTRSSC